MEKLPLKQALQVYWLNVLAIVFTPLLTVLAGALFRPLWPIAFLSLAIFAVILPFRFGKAPLTYVLACQGFFLFGGFLVPLVFWGLWALGISDEILNTWWGGSRN